MIKSFKLHIILQLIVLLCIYIYINRVFSQYLAFEFIQDKVNAELVQLIEDERIFTADNVESKTSFFSNTKFNSLVKCSATHESKNELCGRFEQSPIDWSVIQTQDSKTFEFGKLSLSGAVWHVIRKKNKPRDDYLAIDESEINFVLSSTWEIRDYVLSRVLPLMAFLLILVSYYLSTHIVNIINKIKTIISNTDIKNLNIENQSVSVHYEFQPFIDVFNDLRIRLKASFDQASRFSAEASHELRTPLTILRGYAERGIKNSDENSNEQIQFILMAEEIDRLINITDKLLILARSDAGHLELSPSLVNLTDIFEQLALDAEIINPDLRISTNIQKKVLWECDHQLIHQLIYNLYSNASKYNTKNGWIHFALSQSSNLLTFEILNSSDNVSVDLPKKAFDRFYRGEESHTRKIEGTGLGLSLCKEIAKIHGGDLTLSVNAHQHVSAKFSVNF